MWKTTGSLVLRRSPCSLGIRTQSARQHNNRCHADRWHFITHANNHHRCGTCLDETSRLRRFFVFSVYGSLRPLPRGEGAVGPVTRRRTHESENVTTFYRVARQPRPVQASESRLRRRRAETRARDTRRTLCP